MLKEYHEENGDNVEACAMVVTSKPELKVVGIETYGISDTGVRLKNSVMIANLKNKLKSVNEASLSWSWSILNCFLILQRRPVYCAMMSTWAMQTL